MGVKPQAGPAPDLRVVRQDLPGRLQHAKPSFNTRRVDLTQACQLVDDRAPAAGDLVLARVDSLGQHGRLQLPSGRRAQLYPGDEIVLCYGDRYAANQWEAFVPPTLESCDLVASGGVAGRVRSRHQKTRKPTRITPLGLLANSDDKVLNLRDYALPRHSELPASLPAVLLVAGTGMDAGKTTTASALIRGLCRAGHRVAGIKLTGTGAGNDYWQMLDAGAHCVCDFTDLGFVTTYRIGEEQLTVILASLLHHALGEGCDVAVLELADGPAQTETAAMLESAALREACRGLLLAATDAMGAAAVCARLDTLGYPVLAISGIASASALSAREAERATDVPVLGQQDLQSPATVGRWVAPPRH